MVEAKDKVSSKDIMVRPKDKTKAIKVNNTNRNGRKTNPIGKTQIINKTHRYLKIIKINKSTY